jgi:hypothetical protein
LRLLLLFLYFWFGLRLRSFLAGRLKIRKLGRHEFKYKGRTYGLGSGGFHRLWLWG